MFSEPNKKTVLLVLKNNIASRSVRKMEGLKSLSVDEWANLGKLDREIVYYIANLEQCTMKQLEEHTRRSRPALVKD